MFWKVSYLYWIQIKQIIAVNFKKKHLNTPTIELHLLTLQKAG